MRATGFIVFLIVVFAINFALHGYLWWRLVRSPGWPAPWSRAGGAAVLVLALMLSAALLLMRHAPRGIATPLAWVGFTWLGLLFVMFVLLLAAEPLRPLLRHLSPGGLAFAGVDPGRAVSRIVAIFALVGGVCLGTGAILSARLPARVRTVEVSIPRWPAELTGYTIGQLSDIHAGGTVDKGFIERIVQSANALNADMIVITGDLVDGRVEDLADVVAPLASLRARDGVWFVTGNHEYYSGVNAWIEQLRTMGIRVLRNERVVIRGGHGFDLAGTDDYTAHGFGAGHGQDIPGALDGRDPNRPVVLLAHQPRTFPEAVAHGVDLQISGHTHGGQIFPFHYLTRSLQPFLSGLNRVGASRIYVSRGTGYWGPPMRLGAPSEIARIVISPTDPDGHR
jgi:uncharacterized protein